MNQDEKANFPPDRWAKAKESLRMESIHRDIRMIVILVGGLVMVCLLGSQFRGCGHGRNRDFTTLVNHARMLGLGLLEFETEFGRLPDASTIPEVKKLNASMLTLSDSSSNDFFKQLIVAKIIESEECFGGSGQNFSPPDGKADSDETAIAAGECAFAYVLGPTLIDEPCRPVLFGPVLPGKKSIDLEMSEKRAMIWFSDCTIVTVRVDQLGRFHVNKAEKDDNAPLFDPAHPSWNGKPLVIKWPR